MSSKTHKGKDFYIDNSLFAPIIGTTKLKARDFMQTQLTVLNNGLHVVSKKDETTGMFNIGVWCRCGSRFETPAQNGIAHFASI